MVSVLENSKNSPDQSGCFPPSSLQQAYLFGAQNAFDLHVATHTYFEFRLPSLDIQVLATALNRLINEYEALRMVMTEDGQMQILQGVKPYSIDVVDLTQSDEQSQQQQLWQVRERFERADLDFYTWPCFAVQVTRLPGHIDHVHFNWTPIFVDGRGVSKLFHQLSIYYTQPQTPIQQTEFSYAQYAIRREAQKASDAYAKAKSYWWRRLADLPHGPELPWSQGRQQPMRSQLNRRRVLIDAPHWSAIKARAAEHNLGLTALMLTLYAATIAQWSKTKHFTLTMLIQNRDRDLPGSDYAVGSFASTVLVEVDFRQALSLIEHVKITQKRLFLDLMNTRVCGLEVLQHRNREQHSMAHASSPVAFVSNLEVVADSELSDDLFHRNGRNLVRSNLETPQIALDHQLAETQNGELALNWDAMDEMFYPDVADAMLHTYQALIEDLAQTKKRWHSILDIDMPAEQRNVIEATNNTQHPYDKKLLHTLFHDQAARSEEGPAVIHTAATLNYQQLQQLVATLAAQLQAAGAAPNTVVAVFMHKGWEQVAATLAVLTAGAAYVPIDPLLPDRRIEHLLERCDVKIVLTQPDYTGRAEIQNSHQLVVTLPFDINIDTNTLPTSPVISLDNYVNNNYVNNKSDNDLAYLIFTSGSTGQPKGVVLNHAGPVNTVLDINAKFDIGAQDRVFAISALSFDLSVFDIFGLLAAGGSIVVPEYERIRDPAHWLELMETHKVTVWNSAPALMQMLVEFCRETGRKLPASLRVIMLSGDWIPTWLPTAIQQDLPHAKVYSLGGATEASIWSIYYPVVSVESKWLSIPYGKPLANQTMHVLDKQLNPRPIGVTGDLYIGGIGLAQGYWKDPETTDRSFIAHPRSGTGGESSERLYRTGDLGRYLQDGNIEFLGREDSQIKLQGYRVELGEIETILQQHADVTHAVVIVHGDQNANRRLVAYVATGNRDFSKEALTEHAQQYLPPYMVPTTFILLERMPVTSNGKVDRKNLPSPEPLATSLTEARPAQTPTEHKLLIIWQEVLDVPAERIGANISFFDLGGQSFLSVRMMAKIQQQFGLALPLAILIQADTIAALAEKIDLHNATPQFQHSATQAQSPLVMLNQGSVKSPVYLVHPVGGNVLCYRGLVTELKDLQRTFYGLQSFAALQRPNTDYTLESMAAHYIDAIQQVQPQGPYVLAGWSMGGVIAVEMARQLLDTGNQVEQLVLLDAPAPLDHHMPDTSACVKWFFRDLQGTDALWMDDYLQDLNQRNEDIHWTAVLDHVMEYELVPVGTSREDLDAIFTMFVMNLRALRAYHPRKIHSVGNVLIARASEQPIDELKSHISAHDPAWGWRDWFEQHIEVCSIAGDHYSIFAPQHIANLGRQLKAWLEKS